MQNVLPLDSSNTVPHDISMGKVSMVDLCHVVDAMDTKFPKEHRALIDNGSQLTTTNKRFLLHNYKDVDTLQILWDAGKKVKYKIRGQGKYLVPRGDRSYIGIKCWYTPSLPVTVISQMNMSNKLIPI